MIHAVKRELRVLGSSLCLLSAALLAALVLLALAAGDLLALSLPAFEVALPLYAAIAVGEWGKLRTDGGFEVIAAQSRDLFPWVLARYLAVMGVVCLFALAGMAAVSLARGELPLWEMAAVSFPTVFLFSSLSALCALLFSREHVASLVCGVLWLAALLARGLLRLPWVQFVYPFLRFAGDENGVWPVNKAVMTALGLLLWGLAYRFAKRPAR